MTAYVPDNVWRKQYWRFGRNQFGTRQRVRVYQTPFREHWWWSAGFGPKGPFPDAETAMQECELALRTREGWKEI